MITAYAFLLYKCGWLRYMKLCHTREELARLPQGPKLVLATLPSLQAGMARDLFMEWAPDPKNLVLFTQQAEVRLSTTAAINASLINPSLLVCAELRSTSAPAIEKFAHCQLVVSLLSEVLRSWQAAQQQPCYLNTFHAWKSRMTASLCMLPCLGKCVFITCLTRWVEQQPQRQRCCAST